MFHESGKPWSKNRKSCRRQKGDLVSMETVEEWQFINREIQKHTLQGSNDWHIGLRKRGNKWEWVSGEPLTITDKWQDNEPSGDGNHAVMSKDYPPGSQGLFSDQRGGINTPYICEFKKGKRRC